MNKETKTIYFKVFCTTVAPANAEVPVDLDPREYQNYLYDNFHNVEIDGDKEEILNNEIVEGTFEEE